MTSDLSVIVVNYNAGPDLERCLSSLAGHLTGTWDAVVVDNGSTDGSQHAAARFGPRVALLENGGNTGFARACNQGASRTAGRFILFLNPDARLSGGAVERLRAELETCPACAIAAPAVLDEDGSAQGSARGDPDMLTGLFGRSSWLRRRFPGTRVARRNVVVSVEASAGEAGVDVDWVSGSCMLVRRDAFERAGGFDERYFLYWEDADLCRRLRELGYRVRYRPDATVVHAAGRSSRGAQALAIRAFHRSAYLYYTRHVAPSRWSPRRWLAFGLLHARAWWRLRRASTTTSCLA